MAADLDKVVVDALAALDAKLVRDGLPRFHDNRMAVVHAAMRLHDQRIEHLLAYLLDKDGRLLAIETIAIGSEGSLECSRAHLARRAIVADASDAIIIHNHPSCEPGPSDADRAAAERIDRQLAAVGVLVRGHYTVTQTGFGDIRTGDTTLFADLMKSTDQPAPAARRCPHCAGPLDQENNP